MIIMLGNSHRRKRNRPPTVASTVSRKNRSAYLPIEKVGTHRSALACDPGSPQPHRATSRMPPHVVHANSSCAQDGLTGRLSGPPFGWAAVPPGRRTDRRRCDERRVRAGTHRVSAKLRCSAGLRSISRVERVRGGSANPAVGHTVRHVLSNTHSSRRPTQIGRWSTRPTEPGKESRKALACSTSARWSQGCRRGCARQRFLEVQPPEHRLLTFTGVHGQLEVGQIVCSTGA